jgi:hypothetical protein
MIGKRHVNDAPRYTNIAEINAANKAAGRFWFSPATIEFFDSRVESRVYDEGTSTEYPKGSRLWVESTKSGFDDTRREFKLARFNVETADIDRVHRDWVTLRFTNLGDAESYLTDKLLRPRRYEIVEDWHGKTTSRKEG